jgi:V8-like Glu-specific endopeptidase
MLEYNERQRLIQIIAGLYEFTDGGPRARRVLLQQSNLGRFLSGLDLSGPPRTVAADIMSRIEDFGYLPEEPTKHALGALLCYLLTLGDMPPAEKAFMAGLVVKYSLVADPLYIDKLRAEYGVAEAAVRKPDPTYIAPAVNKALEHDPNFEVNLDEAGLESIINSEDNFLNVYWLFGAIYSSQAVCLIEIPEGTKKGTGFLIGPDLILTNHHVLKNEEYVRKAVARFDYMEDSTGVCKLGRVFRFQPDFYFWSPAEELDYALVRLQDRPLKEVTVEGGELSLMDLVLQGKHRGYLTLRPEYVLKEERVNIIQHPDGDPMKVVLTQNYVVNEMSGSRLQYVADTMEGSSGSPVFNKKWEVVALHHSGAPYPPDSVGQTIKKAFKGRYRVNEGIPMRAILEDFKNRGIERYLPRD